MYGIEILFARRRLSIDTDFSLAPDRYFQDFVNSNNLTESLSVINNSIDYYTEGLIVFYKNGKVISDLTFYDYLTHTISIFVYAVDAFKNGSHLFTQGMPDQPVEVVFSINNDSVSIYSRKLSDQTIIDEFSVSKEFFLDEMPAYIEHLKKTYMPYIKPGARW